MANESTCLMFNASKWKLSIIKLIQLEDRLQTNIVSYYIVRNVTVLSGKIITQ